MTSFCNDPPTRRCRRATVIGGRGPARRLRRQRHHRRLRLPALQRHLVPAHDQPHGGGVGPARRHPRARATTTATATPTSPCSGRPTTPGTCARPAPPPSCGERPATSPCPPTTTATAPPTSPCSDPPTAPGTCARPPRRRSCGARTATSPSPATTTATAPPTWPCSGRPTTPGTCARPARPPSCGGRRRHPRAGRLRRQRHHRHRRLPAATGTWYLRTASPTAIVWGQNGDVPAPGDYDGNGTIDLAVFRPANNALVHPHAQPRRGGVGSDGRHPGAPAAGHPPGLLLPVGAPFGAPPPAGTVKRRGYPVKRRRHQCSYGGPRFFAAIVVGSTLVAINPASAGAGLGVTVDLATSVTVGQSGAPA